MAQINDELLNAKHPEYWYIILPDFVVAKPAWFNMVQEDNAQTVRNSTDSRYLLRVRKENITEEILAGPPFTIVLQGTTVRRYMTYRQAFYTLSVWEPHLWEEPLTDGSEGNVTE